MILPQKHLKLSESLLGLGWFVLAQLKTPKDLDGIWVEYQKAYASRRYPAHHTFENIIMSVVFLFSLGVIVSDEDGKLKYATN